MAILRTDIERALDELASQEEGMRFQGLAVVLGKKLWPELIARQRKKDFGLDAYAPSSLTPEKIGKGLAASITPSLKKVSHDIETAMETFHDLKALLFVTSAKVGNTDRKLWEEEIQRKYDVELHIIEREEIITQMMTPANVSLCASFLNLSTDVETQVADLIARTKRAANVVIQTWASKTKGYPLIELTSVRLDSNGAESTEKLSLGQIDQALSQSRRIVLEGPAGRGKTTTLIQIAQLERTAGIPFIIGLPTWISSHRSILEYVAGMPPFQAEGLTATDLSRIQQIEPFILLLNGWNEITESTSVQADDALRVLERDFPSAGIIVATRTHHLTPPLPGSLRLRLLPLRSTERTAYLESRLGEKSVKLLDRINTDSALDELTRTPFILSEVTSLFEADAEIPSTKIGVLAEVLNLHEQREEHRNALQVTPIFGQQADYLKALAIEMTHRGAVTLNEADARAVITVITRNLVEGGQIEPVGAPTVLATLTAHHILERVEYPQTTFQFEHQQLQEYYTALEVHTQFLNLSDDNSDATNRFITDYVNDLAWAEPLRMIAEKFSEQSGDTETDNRNIRAGGKLIEMALSVDLVFAGELAQLCGARIWNEISTTVGERFREVYAFDYVNYRQYALAAMVATNTNDFKDILEPLLSGQDQQVRLGTYRLWPDIQVSSLGPNWREIVSGWSNEARADFVSELLHHRFDAEVASFAAGDESIEVKKAAIYALMWTGSDDALIRVLESMDVQAFEDIARKNATEMPAAFRSRTIAAMKRFIESATDHPARLRTALDLIKLSVEGLDDIFKSVLTGLTRDDIRKMGSHYIHQVLEYLRKTDLPWVSEWVAIQLAEDVLYNYDYWLPFTTAIPDELVEKYLLCLETEDSKTTSYKGIITVIAAHANANLAKRVFEKVRELQLKIDKEPEESNELAWQVLRRLGTLFRSFSGDVAATGILSSVTKDDPLDIMVATDLLSKVARSDLEPLSISNNDLKTHLRTYLKDSVDLVLQKNDYTGEEKAHLASSIAQVGEPEDMTALVKLIRADIERIRRGRAARSARDSGPLVNGSIMSYAAWHISAVKQLDPTGAAQVLVELLSEKEYRFFVTEAMMQDFVLKSDSRTSRGDLIWAAREGRARITGDKQRRIRFANALNAEIRRLREQTPEGSSAEIPKELAAVLSTIDGQGSAELVLDVIGKPGQWDHHIGLFAAEQLLMAGVVLPTKITFTLVDSILERAEKWMNDHERYLLFNTLALCPFIDDPVAGIAKIREVLDKFRFRGNELRSLITALGESRSDTAIDLLLELASDSKTLEYCKEYFIKSIAALDTPRARTLLLGFVDPDIQGITPHHLSYGEYELVTQLITGLARRSPEVATRLLELCERDLTEHNRRVLSTIMALLGTPEAFTANLNIIDDAKPSPIPEGIWGQLKSAFIERRPYGQNTNMFTEHARASNELRLRLFRMVIEDEKRRKSAFILLGQIENWRLEHGRPMAEPRHPNLASGQPWPPNEP